MIIFIFRRTTKSKKFRAITIEKKDLQAIIIELFEQSVLM